MCSSSHTNPHGNEYIYALAKPNANKDANVDAYACANVNAYACAYAYAYDNTYYSVTAVANRTRQRVWRY